MATALALAGCAGDDGSDGTSGLSAYEIAVQNGFVGTEEEWLASLQGDGEDGLSAYEIAVQNGFVGTEEEWLQSLEGAAIQTSVPREACVVCHGQTGIAVVEEVHNVGVGDIEVVNLTVTPNVPAVGDLSVSFNVRFNGLDKGTYDRITRDYRLEGTLLERRDLSNDGTPATLARQLVVDPVTDEESTLYTITIAGGETANGLVPSRYMFRVEDPVGATAADRRVLVVFDYPAAPVADVLGDVACAQCHGPLGSGFHYGYPAAGGKACVVCHDASNTDYPRFYPMIHGIHNSANMPTGEYTVVDAAGAPLVEDGVPVTFSIGFPSYMVNCSICHSTDAALALTNAEPVTFDFCMTCHQNFDGFGAADFGGINHANMTAATDCTICHNDAIAPATHAGMHNLQEITTDRGGLIWDGVDASIVLGNRVVQEFAGVTRDGDNLVVDWTATVDGLPVDPCNTTVGPNAPTWQSGFSILKAFFTGDDLLNANNGNRAPGQANSVNLVFVDNPATEEVEVVNTVCVNNVATSTIPLTADEAALTGKARIGLQGRPRMTFTPAAQDILIRAKSPVFDFDVTTGAAATPRRIVIDNDLCIGCHVGSLYQHGGNRIDNEELCIMCHNEASNDKNVRLGYGVDASEAYDGKSGQTYGFKTMLHAIHATGETGAPYVVYRTRGIFAFAGSPDVLRNWPGTGTQTVFGSDPAATQNHNFVTAHFPRRINDCAACHVDDFTRMPNPTISMATTVEPGTAPFDNQVDDALEGPTAAACMSCHQSTVPFEQNALKAHAYSNGWVPQVFTEGRQTIINVNQ